MRRVLCPVFFQMPKCPANAAPLKPVVALMLCLLNGTVIFEFRVWVQFAITQDPHTEPWPGPPRLCDCTS